MNEVYWRVFIITHQGGAFLADFSTKVEAELYKLSWLKDCTHITKSASITSCK